MAAMVKRIYIDLLGCLIMVLWLLLVPLILETAPRRQVRGAALNLNKAIQYSPPPVCVRLQVCVCVRVRLCVRANVRGHVCLHVCACVHVCVQVYV